MEVLVKPTSQTAGSAAEDVTFLYRLKTGPITGAYVKTLALLSAVFDEHSALVCAVEVSVISLLHIPVDFESMAERKIG